jgi:nucleoid DNA-binding protein
MAVVDVSTEEVRIMAKSTTEKKNKPLSKSEIVQAVADAIGEEISRKHVKEVVETLATVGHKELKKNGIFVLPGFAKFVVVKKPARPARDGINPFTKEKQRFAAKPASKAVRARPVKAVKDAVR